MNESSKETEAASYAVTASEAWTWDASQLAELNRHLDKPFGEVELFNRCLAFALWQTGHPVEFWSVGAGWEASTRPLWAEFGRYRVLPKPEPLVLPSIDWSAVSPRLQWLTQDLSGVMIVFERKPSPNEENGSWSAGFCGHMTHADNFSSAKYGRGNWRKLIVQRPEVV